MAKKNKILTRKQEARLLIAQEVRRLLAPEIPEGVPVIHRPDPENIVLVADWIATGDAVCFLDEGYDEGDDLEDLLDGLGIDPELDQDDPAESCCGSGGEGHAHEIPAPVAEIFETLLGLRDGVMAKIHAL